VDLHDAVEPQRPPGRGRKCSDQANRQGLFKKKKIAVVTEKAAAKEAKKAAYA
jgi:hypothetical protein